MNSLERVSAVLQHRAPDCVPVCPMLLLQGAAALDMGLAEYFSRGEYLAEGQIRLWEKFRHDFVFGFPHITEDITAFGAPLKYYRNGPPSPGGMAIQSYDDVFNLTAPDPAASPVLAETLHAIRLLAERLKGDVPILGACIAPFSLPSMLMGTEAWMELLFVEEESVREQVFPRLMEIMIDFVVAWANAQLAAGVDAVILADGMSSAAVLDRQLFYDLALPVLNATIPRIQGAVIHEGVGDLQPMLDLLVDTGVLGVILTPNDDLAHAKHAVGDQLTLIGNLNNIAMRRWSAAEMTQQAEVALGQAAPESGFILSAQGPEIPLGVSDDVIHAMVRAAHSWRY